jgi:precorrin-3B methylase
MHDLIFLTWSKVFYDVDMDTCIVVGQCDTNFIHVQLYIILFYINDGL